MTILTIITNSNDHTIYFKEPIKNFQYIKLISCSLYNSWINLEENGNIIITDFEKNPLENNVYQFPPGHHTPESVLYFFKTINYFSKLNSPRGILVLPNPKNKTVTTISQNLLELFDVVHPKISTDLTIKKFKTSQLFYPLRFNEQN